MGSGSSPAISARYSELFIENTPETDHLSSLTLSFVNKEIGEKKVGLPVSQQILIGAELGARSSDSEAS